MGGACVCLVTSVLPPTLQAGGSSEWSSQAPDTTSITSVSQLPGSESITWPLPVCSLGSMTSASRPKGAWTEHKTVHWQQNAVKRLNGKKSGSPLNFASDYYLWFVSESQHMSASLAVFVRTQCYVNMNKSSDTWTLSLSLSLSLSLYLSNLPPPPPPKHTQTHSDPTMLQISRFPPLSFKSQIS